MKASDTSGRGIILLKHHEIILNNINLVAKDFATRK